MLLAGIVSKYSPASLGKGSPVINKEAIATELCRPAKEPLWLQVLNGLPLAGRARTSHASRSYYLEMIMQAMATVRVAFIPLGGQCLYRGDTA